MHKVLIVNGTHRKTHLFTSYLAAKVYSERYLCECPHAVLRISDPYGKTKMIIS